MGEEQLSASRTLAEKILGRFTALRTSLRERILEVNHMSQREIIHAAEEVNTIYHIATSQIKSLKLHLTAHLNQHEKRKTLSPDTQITSIHQCVKNFNQRIREIKGIVSKSAKLNSQLKKAAEALANLTLDRHETLPHGSGSTTKTPKAGSVQVAGSAGSRTDHHVEISAISATIRRLTSTLGSLTPLLEDQIVDLGEHLKTFSAMLRGDISVLTKQDLALRKDVARALETGDIALGTIVKSSQSALSHMQFQDAISQGLMRLDTIAHENEVAICREMGLEARIASITPAMHEELGGDKAVEQKNAGKVVLF